MSLTSRDTGGEQQEPVTQAVHHAVCCGIWDCGTQVNPRFQTAQLKVVFMWEVPGETHTWKNRDTGEETTRPKVITRRFTNSLSTKAHLRAMLESWRGKPFTEQELNGFHLGKVAGANCLIQVIHEPTRQGGIFPKVANVMKLVPGTPVLEPVRETIVFDIDEATEIPEFTPSWIKNMILASPEWAQKTGAAEADQQMGTPPPGYDAPPPIDAYDDDIPF